MRSTRLAYSGIPPRSLDGLRLGLFLLLLLFLNVQGDGFWPADEARSKQVLLLPLTALFTAGLLSLLFPEALPRRHLETRIFAPFSTWRGLLIAAMGSLLLTSVLFLLEARYYTYFGYRLHPLLTALVFGSAFLALAFHLRPSNQTSDRSLLFSVLLTYTTVCLLSIRSFPLAARRSDMLPLLSAASRSLLDGQDPYRLHTLASGPVFLTYLPGTLLAYVPLTLLGVDLRFGNIVYILLLFFLLYRASASSHRRAVVAILAIWILSPYLQYRHEIYTEPHWLSLTAAILLAYKGRLHWAAVAFGLSISQSQFSWVLFPFFLLFVFERRGSRYSLASGGISLLTATVIVLPFVAWSPAAFVNGVFRHWAPNAVNARPINLSFFLATGIGPQHLQAAQFLVLSGIFLVSLATHSCGTLSGCLRCMAIALTSFILLNVLIWGYFFLLLELLLLLNLLTANGWLDDSPSVVDC